MFKMHLTSLRRFAGYVTALLLLPASLNSLAAAQAPLVTSGTPTAVPHNETYGAPWQTAVSNRGDFVLFDFKSSGLYQFPAGNGAEITIAAPGVIAGGFTDSGIAIDPRNNNLYLNNNFNGGILEYPYDAATGTWDLPAVTVASGLAGNLGGSCGNYFQGAGMAINGAGVMAVATENGCGVEIFTVPIDTSGNFGAATPIVANMTKRAKTVAIDDAGNVFFTEDAGGVAGAVYIPAGTTGLSTDTSAVRIDPNLSNVQGVTVDPDGNVYIVDGTAGAYLVPSQSGAPNPTQAVLLSTIAAAGGPSLDVARGILFYPIGTTGTIKDLVKIFLGRAKFGPVAVGTVGGTAASVTYSFNASATPTSFVIKQDGLSGVFATGDLSGCGVTSTTTTTYAANATCTIPITFTPTTAADVSATLFMLDAKGNVLNSTLLYGSATGPLVLGIPGTESAIGASFKTPSQVTTDASGNVYVADSGLGKVLMYAKGAGTAGTSTSIGTGLTAPTGVAVDGTGNVYIADSGKVIEVPYGVSGLNAAAQVTLKSGLGKNLKLVVDAIGDVFIGDPDNQRFIRLRNIVNSIEEVDTASITQLLAIATSGAGSVYVVNGQNLVRYSEAGPQTLLTSLANTTGLAVDVSGAAYVTSSTQTIRIPNEAGTLNPAHQAVLAQGVKLPSSVAVDSTGNIYVLDAAAGNVDYTNANASLNLGTLGTTTATSTASATIINTGNTPLTVTGFSSSADYAVTANTCVSAPVAVGATCSATVTFDPGPGDQGTLKAQLLVQGNPANAPIGINLTGIGATLANSTTSILVTKPSVTNAPVIVTVASANGTGPVPTGNVTVTVSGKGLQTITSTQPLINGTVTVNETAVPVGSLTFTANYIGDRVYGTSTASATATVAQGTVMLIQPAAASVPIYVLAGGAGAQEPYDGSQMAYYYNYPVTVKAANGAPLLGVPITNAAGTQTGSDYGIVTYQIAGGTPACSGSAATINVNADGTAPFPTSCFSINTSNNQVPDLLTSYTVTPVYTDNTDPNYATVTGSPVTLIALRNPSVIITSNPGSLTVAAGSSVTSNLTITSLLGYGVLGTLSNLNNYSLPLAMQCDALPAHTTCSFSYPTPDPSDPNSVAVNPTTPGTVIMTLNTNVSVGTVATAGATGRVAELAAFFSIGLLGLASGRRRKLRAAMLSYVVLLIGSAAFVSLSGCTSANISATPSLTTPKGTFAITVTAKQTGSKTVPNPTAGGAPITVYGNGNQISIPFTMNVTVQ